MLSPSPVPGDRHFSSTLFLVKDVLRGENRNLCRRGDGLNLSTRVLDPKLWSYLMFKGDEMLFKILV